MLHIASVLTPAEVAQVRALVDGQDWIDGRATAGHLSATVKHNRQLAETDPKGLEAAALVLKALSRNGVFAAAALPAQIAPPLFNRHDPGQGYGDHIDGAMRPLARGRMRADLSATLFLTDPGDYDGGDLVIRSAGGDNAFRLNAGDLLLYDSGAIHHVAPVTRGRRTACFFWVQSLIRDPARRAMLYDLDATIQRLQAAGTASADVLALTAHYHNLLRQWMDG